MVLSSARSHAQLGGVAGQQRHDAVVEQPQALPSLGCHACTLPGQRLALQDLDAAHHLHSTPPSVLQP